MPAVQLREFSTGAEVIANARAVKARIAAYRSPRAATLPPDSPKPAPSPSAPSSLECSLGTREPKWGGNGAGSFSITQPEEPQQTVLPTIAAIVHACAIHYGVTVFDICSHRRAAAIVRPRQVAMYLAKIGTLRSMPQIGRYMGGRDHTTVLHAVRKIEALQDRDGKLKSDIAEIRSILAPVTAADPNQLALPLAGEVG